MVHHRIVALEAVHTAPPTFELPHPHTYDIDVYHRTEPHQLHERIRDASIIIDVVHPIRAAALDPAVTPNLKLIALMAAGTDCVDLDACRKRGIRVMNCAHANVQSVAEHALGLYFAARRRTLIMHERTVGTLGDGSEWVANNTLTPHMRAAGRAPLNCDEEVVAIIGNGGIGESWSRTVREILVLTDGRQANASHTSPARWACACSSRPGRATANLSPTACRSKRPLLRLPSSSSPALAPRKQRTCSRPPSSRRCDPRLFS